MWHGSLSITGQQSPKLSSPNEGRESPTCPANQTTSVEPSSATRYLDLDGMPVLAVIDPATVNDPNHHLDMDINLDVVAVNPEEGVEEITSSTQLPAPFESLMEEVYTLVQLTMLIKLTHVFYL